MDHLGNVSYLDITRCWLHLLRDSNSSKGLINRNPHRTPRVQLGLRNDSNTTPHDVIDVPQYANVKATTDSLALSVLINASNSSIVRASQHQPRHTNTDSIPARTTSGILRELGPCALHELTESVFLNGGICLRVGSEDEWDFRGVVYSEIRVALGVGEGGVEVVAPGRRADCGGGIGEEGAGALKDVVCEDG